jgi:hypothetical protein
MSRAIRIVNFGLLVGFLMIGPPTTASAQQQTDKVQTADAHLHLGLLYLAMHDESWRY